MVEEVTYNGTLLVLDKCSEVTKVKDTTLTGVTFSQVQELIDIYDTDDFLILGLHIMIVE